jgi:hypothetical protein
LLNSKNFPNLSNKITVRSNKNNAKRQKIGCFLINSIITPLETRRPPPPDELTPEQAEVWRMTVAAMPARNTDMSVYKPKGSPYYHFDFQMRGNRFFGSTRCSDRRQAEAVERSEREKAKAVSKCDRDLPHTYGEAAARFWNEVGQHNATADDTRRNLVWLGEAIGEHTPLWT